MEAALNLFFDALRVASKYHSEQALAQPLEHYRMAATNLPIQEAALAVTRTELLDALAAACRGKWTAEEEQLFTKGYATSPLVTTTSAALSSNATADYRTKSCYVQTQMQQVFPGLFIGSFHPASDAALMTAAGITHVCCCIDVSPRFPKQFAYLTLAADDNAGFDISVFFAKAFAFIDSALRSGGGVLVHCGAGISRAPTILASYLMRKTGMSAKAAVQHIKSIRSCASPNRGFLQQLDALEKSLRSNATTRRLKDEDDD